MKHSKLLDKIDILGHTSSWKALRAVVELHKPSQDYKGQCDAETDGEYFYPWPCPTIQAIEKEIL